MTSCILFDFLKLKGLTLTLGITTTVEKSSIGQKRPKHQKEETDQRFQEEER